MSIYLKKAAAAFTATALLASAIPFSHFGGADLTASAVVAGIIYDNSDAITDNDYYFYSVNSLYYHDEILSELIQFNPGDTIMVNNNAELDYLRLYVNSNFQGNGGSLTANSYVVNPGDLTWKLGADIDCDPVFDYSDFKDADGVVMFDNGTASVPANDLSESPLIAKYLPIGTVSYGFAGTFDGNGYTISDLCVVGNSDGIGMFGTASGATIKNFKLENSLITNSVLHAKYYGGICGNTNVIGSSSGLHHVNIENVTFSGAVVAKADSTSCMSFGGICGKSINAVISRCINYGFVCYNGNNGCGINCGGIVGELEQMYVNEDAIIDCVNYGSVKGYVNCAGILGILSAPSSTTPVKRSVNLGSVEVGQVGVPIGLVIASESVTLPDCYSVKPEGSVYNYLDSDCIGGVISNNNAALIAYRLQCSSDGAWGIDETGYPALGGERLYCKGDGTFDTIGPDTHFEDGVETVSDNGNETHTIVFSCCGVPVTESCDYINGICSKCGAYEAPTSVNGYYEIDNFAKLMVFAEMVNNGKTKIDAKLTADITLNDESFELDIDSGIIVVSDPAGNIGYLGTGFQGDFAGKSVPGVWYTADSLQGDYSVTDTYGGDILEWNPIGIVGSQYRGTFAGGNHTIYGMFVDTHAEDKQGNGFFGNVNGATISNLAVKNGVVIAQRMAGGVIGRANNSTASLLCSDVIAVSTVTDASCGGLIGYATAGILQASYCVGYAISGNKLGEYPVSASDDSLTVGGCYFLNGSITKPGTMQRSSEEFANGTVAYELRVYSLLNGLGNVWGQDLSRDEAPILTTTVGLFVYCKNGVYANGSPNIHIGGDDLSNYVVGSNGKHTILVCSHCGLENVEAPCTYVGGFCKYCGAYGGGRDVTYQAGQLTLPVTPTVTGTEQFIGWLKDDGSLYYGGESMNVEAETSFTAVVASIEPIAASAKLSGNAGIRFATELKLSGDSAAIYDAASLRAGTLIWASDLVDEEAFYYEDFVNNNGMYVLYEDDANIIDTVDFGGMQRDVYYASLVEIYRFNYARDFTAKSFVIAQFADGTEKCFYSTTTINRNIYSLAQAAFCDRTEEEGTTGYDNRIEFNNLYSYSCYSNGDLAKLTTFLDGVVDISFDKETKEWSYNMPDTLANYYAPCYSVMAFDTDSYFRVIGQSDLFYSYLGMNKNGGVVYCRVSVLVNGVRVTPSNNEFYTEGSFADFEMNSYLNIYFNKDNATVK